MIVRDGFKAEWIEPRTVQTEVCCRLGSVDMPATVRVTGKAIRGKMEWVANLEDAPAVQLSAAIDLAKAAAESNFYREYDL